MKIHTTQLTKKDWDNLRQYNLIDDGEGNGFANTTKFFDDKVGASVYPRYVHIKASVYQVAYYDGCFYPMWYKIQYITDFKPYEVIRLKKRRDNNIIIERKMMELM